MKTDIEIARECKLANIDDVAKCINIPVDALEHYGKPPGSDGHRLPRTLLRSAPRLLRCCCPPAPAPTNL